MTYARAEDARERIELHASSVVLRSVCLISCFPGPYFELPTLNISTTGPIKPQHVRNDHNIHTIQRGLRGFGPVLRVGAARTPISRREPLRYY